MTLKEAAHELHTLFLNNIREGACTGIGTDEKNNVICIYYNTKLCKKFLQKKLLDSNAYGGYSIVWQKTGPWRLC